MFVRLIRLPATKVLPFESAEMLAYDAAHRKGKNNVYCQSAYPECSFSLIELALGAYSSPMNFM